MQPEYHFSNKLFPNPLPNLPGWIKVGVIVVLFAFSGCGQTFTTIDPPPSLPYAGTTLTVGCSDSIRHPELARLFVKEWSSRTGASLTFESIASKNLISTDIAIINPAELPELAVAGRILPVPSSLQGRDNPYQWDGLFQMHSGILATWGGTTYGIPLFGEGRLLVYRADRFAEKKISPPETWEEYVAAARALMTKGRPSLGPLPARPEDLDAEFHLIAACYDRPALNQSELGSGIPDEATADRIYSYHYRLKTTQPRINAAPFLHAFNLLRELKKFREPGEADRPADAFAAGRTSLCIATLEDLAGFQKLDSPVRGKFRVAPLPGGLFTYDLESGQVIPNRASMVNRMPYLGSKGWIGVVNKKCANPQAAFEFLADFGNPEKMGAEVIVSAKWGAGPIRSLQTEERSQGLWLGYDLSRDETDQLIRALKDQLQSSIINHRYRLRLPNQRQHLETFDALVRPALLAEQANAQKTLNQVAAKWNYLWADVPNARKRAWIDLSHGLGASQ